jgi:hypothetical protein
VKKLMQLEADKAVEAALGQTGGSTPSAAAPQAAAPTVQPAVEVTAGASPTSYPQWHLWTRRPLDGRGRYRRSNLRLYACRDEGRLHSEAH